MTGKLFAWTAAVTGAAGLTLAIVIALVRGTTVAVSIDDLPLRILAVGADLVLGTVLLVGCIYLATHLAVRVLGVGNAEFPLPELTAGENAQPIDSLPDSPQPGVSQLLNPPRN